MSNLVGLFPAAGRGSRLGTIPCSKEIMPLGFQSSRTEVDQETWLPMTAIETHLHAFQLAGVQQVGIVVGPSKWDIVRYLGNGERFGMHIAYFYQEKLKGMPFALDLGFHWVKDATVLFSMPDTLITPVDTMVKLIELHNESKADVTLGLFPTDSPQKFGMVEINIDQQIIDFIDKPSHTNLTLMWGCAAWSKRFTLFLHNYLGSLLVENEEVVLSDIFLSALKAGLHFEPLQVDNGHYHDIGTPESFQAAVYELALQQNSGSLY